MRERERERKREIVRERETGEGVLNPVRFVTLTAIVLAIDI